MGQKHLQTEEMITDNCLVGCKHDQHHRHCDLFVYNDLKAIPFTSEVDLSKRILLKRLEEIVSSFDLKYRLYCNSEAKMKRYYFVYHCLNKLLIFDHQIQSFLDLNFQNFLYARRKHLELKDQKVYKNAIKELEIELNKLGL